MNLTLQHFTHDPGKIEEGRKEEEKLEGYKNWKKWKERTKNAVGPRGKKIKAEKKPGYHVQLFNCASFQDRVIQK